MAPNSNIVPVQARLAQTEPHTPEEPRPLFRAPGEPQPYPLDALGPLAPAARAIVEHTQAPAAIAAQAVLGAAALATQGHANALHPLTDARTPLSLFLLTVAESGERKSAVDALALAPVREREAALADAAAEERRAFDIDKQLHDAERADIDRRLGAKGRDKATGAEADLRALSAAPEPPLQPLLVCPDPTVEGHAKLTAIGQPSMGLFSSEAGAFIGGFGMNKENRLKTAAALSELWDGAPIKRVRAGDDLLFLHGRRLSMHLMAQPSVANQILSDPMLADQGLLSRILVAAPASTMGARRHRQPSHEAKRDLQAFQARLKDLLEAPVPLKEGTRNTLAPRSLPCAADAKALAVVFADEIEAGLAPDGAWRPISGFANKIVEHATRLAGVLTLFERRDAPEISRAQMDRAITLARFYLADMLRLRDAAVVPEQLRDAQRLLDWLHNKWPHQAIYPSAIYQGGPLRSLRVKAAAVAALTILEEHGWVVRADGIEIDERRRKEAWRLVGR